MEKLIVIRTQKELMNLATLMKDQEYIALDCETNGLDKESFVIGFSVAWSVDTAYYVILREYRVEQGELVELETRPWAASFLKTLKGKKLIGHNFGFDAAMIENNFNLSLIDDLFIDTMILGHLLDENRSNGLKELAVSIFGEESAAEQAEMKESVTRNGGVLNKESYELWKGDSELIARYGAKDTILTMKLFYLFVEELYEQNLQDFFFEESMPLYKGPTYQMNTTGLMVDAKKMQKLKEELESENLNLKAFIYKEINPIVSEKYPATSPAKTFNINAPKQLSWLLFIKLKNDFQSLTKEGRNLCKAINMKPPYHPKARRDFIDIVEGMFGHTWADQGFNRKTNKKIGDVWNYIACDKEVLTILAKKYKWVASLLQYHANQKLLSTYVEGVQSRMSYNVIRPSFLQHGTTSGRYSCKNPNFQNLPRDDKRIKSCIIARPGKVFVGADQSQLEPRIFAFQSKDETLQRCFSEGKDFYSVVGMPVFGKTDCSAYKDDANSFANKHKDLRNKAKAFSLATPYGTSAFQQSRKQGGSIDEWQGYIDAYFAAYPKVELMMLESHEEAKKNGVVYNHFGRPRRIPKAKEINELFGDSERSELPYEYRTLLNLSMNHKVQSTAASVMNRSAISVYKQIKSRGWTDVKIVLQVHDSLILEGPEALAEEMRKVLQFALEDTIVLEGVKLEAKPVVGTDLAQV